jgi:hypothetical protein
LERLSVGVVPRVLRDVLAADEHRLEVPVVHLTGEEAAPLEEQDPLARRRQREGERAPSGAAPDDDHVAVLTHCSVLLVRSSPLLIRAR